jgi:8-oxo-dGTP pyrophosphatase MutT (NUDIX family)
MYIFGAGVLPYARWKGKVYFLLGKESKRYPNENWEGSDKWCGFGGKRENGNSVELTAIYEFFEETMGSVYGLKQIRSIIYNKLYTLHHDLQVDDSKQYRTYLIKVPKQDYNIIFQRTREFYNYIGCTDKHCNEKTRLQWFSARQLYNIANGTWNFEKDGPQPKFRKSFVDGLKNLILTVDLRNLN